MMSTINDVSAWEVLDRDRRALLVGEYLLVRCWQEPLHVYRLVQAGQAIHHHTTRIELGTNIYALAWIEDDEHTTALPSAA